MTFIRTVFGVIVVIGTCQYIRDHGVHPFCLFFLVFGFREALHTLFP
jgi:hypothetical protein